MTAAVSLFEADPELLAAVPVRDRPLACRGALLAVQRLPPGGWEPAALGAPPWGLLVLEGLLAREVDVATVGAAELLGPGDVLLPGGTAAGEALPGATRWTVLQAGRVAMLDDRLAPIVQRWPHLSALLVQRAARRADRLALARAISHLTRVDARVLATLWQLAERWGRVTPGGVVLSTRLTHRTIAGLIGARRPSVTSAMTDLTKRGLIERRGDGAWVLRGPPPADLDAVTAGPPPPVQRRPGPGVAAPSC
ncbi:MAG TPA: helix-turn-helix domain-containing protein [Capillimicrobium sp.]|nr:helix-turn-helix domain-containing protein [Capillimicrobium sp.]